MRCQKFSCNINSYFHAFNRKVSCSSARYLGCVNLPCALPHCRLVWRVRGVWRRGRCAPTCSSILEKGTPLHTPTPSHSRGHQHYDTTHTPGYSTTTHVMQVFQYFMWCIVCCCRRRSAGSCLPLTLLGTSPLVRWGRLVSSLYTAPYTLHTHTLNDVYCTT